MSGDRGAVLALRCRLVRNVAGFAFGQKLPREEAIRLASHFERGVRRLPAPWQQIDLFRADVRTRNILDAGGYIDPTTPAAARQVYVWYPRTDCWTCGVITINVRDHLEIHLDAQGFLGRSAEALELASTLRPSESWTVDVKRGYLSSALEDCGTGMSFAALVHLPALALGGTLPEIRSRSFIVRPSVGNFGRPRRNPGIFGVCRVEFKGQSEMGGQVAPGQLDDAVQLLLHYEEQALERLLKTARAEVEDACFRACAVLSSARSMDRHEAAELLAWYRMGVNLGLFGRHELATEAVGLLEAGIKDVLGTQTDASEDRTGEWLAQRLRGIFAER